MAVIVPIAADYDGSGVKQAQQAFANFGQTLFKTLQAAGRDARKAFGDLEQGAQDSTSAAQRLATAITQSAERLDAELKQSTAAADALAAALGPEFAAKLGRNGLNKLVGDLNRAGVSLQDITTEADTLAGAIKRVDEVNLSNVTAETENVATGVQKTGVQVTAANQAFASFTGQATAELANLGGSVGAIASGLGQVVTQGVAGRASLLELAKVAGPMLALSVVLIEIKQVFADIKKSKAFTTAEVKAYTTALSATASISTVVRDRIDEVGGAFVKVQKSRQRFSPGWFFHLPASSEIRDITDQLVSLGLKSQDVARFVAAGKPKVDEYVAALKAAGVSSSTTALVQKYLYQQIENTGDAAKAAAVKTQFGVGATDQLASSMDATTIAAAAAQVAIDAKAASDERAAAAAEALAQADLKQADAIDAVRESLYKRNNARYAAVDADQQAKDAIAAYQKAQAKANETGKASDIATATDLQRAAEKAINDAAGAYDNLAGQQYRYADETTRANAQTAAAVDELGRLGKLIGSGSDLVSTVEQWIFLLESIPTEIVTRLGISFGSAVQPKLPNIGTGMPGVSQSVMDGWKSTFTSSAGGGSPTVINVTGAMDPVAVAKQIDKTLTRNSQRNGTGS